MYKPFLDAIAKQASEGRSLDAPVAGSGRLGAGLHQVSVASVDMDRLPTDGSFELQLEGSGRASTVQRIWLLTRDKSRISPGFVQLINALFLRPVAYDRFIEIYKQMGDQTFNLFRGLKLNVLLVQSPGFQIQVLPSRKIIAVDNSGRNLLGAEYPSVTDARAAAEARGYRRSFLNISKWETIDELTADTNWEAFNLAANTLREQFLRSKAGSTLPEAAAAADSKAAP